MKSDKKRHFYLLLFKPSAKLLLNLCFLFCKYGMVIAYKSLQHEVND